MPQLVTVLNPEDMRRPGAFTRLDLSAYLSLIDAVRRQSGVGGEVTLAEGEQQRTEKRRLSIAAKQQGYRLIWRRAPAGQLRFVLAKDGQPVPGDRSRRPKVVEPVAMSEPEPAPRGRRKKAS
jgi:hypothetical protein